MCFLMRLAAYGFSFPRFQQAGCFRPQAADPGRALDQKMWSLSEKGHSKKNGFDTGFKFFFVLAILILVLPGGFDHRGPYTAVCLAGKFLTCRSSSL